MLTAALFFLLCTDCTSSGKLRAFIMKEIILFPVLSYFVNLKMIGENHRKTSDIDHTFMVGVLSQFSTSQTDPDWDHSVHFKLR